MLIRKYMNKATRGMIEAEMKQNFFTIKSKKQVASAATENLKEGGWMQVTTGEGETKREGGASREGKKQVTSVATENLTQDGWMQVNIERDRRRRGC